MHLFHTWTDWTEPFEITSVRDAGAFGDTKTIQTTVQSKCCRECRKVINRKIHDGAESIVISGTPMA